MYGLLYPLFAAAVSAIPAPAPSPTLFSFTFDGVPVTATWTGLNANPTACPTMVFTYNGALITQPYEGPGTPQSCINAAPCPTMTFTYNGAVITAPYQGPGVASSCLAKATVAAAPAVTSAAQPIVTTTRTTLATSTTTAASTSTPAVFGLMSLRSGSSIHFGTVQARNGAFFIGGSPSTYCPLTDKSSCPAGNTTAFNPMTNNGLGLSVAVPGGQQVYVTSSGALAYTGPHSAYIPSGSATGPFTYTAGTSYGILSFTGLGANGFVACPSTAAGANGNYQVFANVAGGSFVNCLGFTAAALTESGTAAYQYA